VIRRGSRATTLGSSVSRPTKVAECESEPASELAGKYLAASEPRWDGVSRR
jgi:hypothetical protein